MPVEVLNPDGLPKPDVYRQVALRPEAGWCFSPVRSPETRAVIGLGLEIWLRRWSRRSET